MNPIKEWGEEAGRQAESFFSFLDNHLEGREFIYGDDVTAADLTAFCTVDFAKVVNIRITPEQKNLQAWYERMKERDSSKV
jgi:glutathione S-transferase